MSSVPEIAVQNLDHFGLVAGLIDEIGIVEKINQLVGEKPGEIVSPGHAVKAMILNGLGLCRVPLTLKQAKQLIEQLSEKDFVESTIAGYRWAAQTSNYGGVRQRWLVVESEASRVSDLCQLEKNIDKAHQEAKKKLRELAAQELKSQPDAFAAATRLSKQLKYHNLVQIKTAQVVSESETASSHSAESCQQAYKIQAQLEPDAGVIAN